MKTLEQIIKLHNSKNLDDKVKTIPFEELTNEQRTIRNLIYAIETRGLHHKAHPINLSEQWMNKSLKEAKEIAKDEGIPLVEWKREDYY